MSRVDIHERSFQFAVRVVRLYRAALARDRAAREIGFQLLRAGTSIGANSEEAQSAQSHADFIAKMSIAEKESREVVFWLRLIAETDLVPAKRLIALRSEADELRRIISAIVLTAKRNRRKKRTLPQES